MGKGLTGKRVALAASRKTEEMTSLIEKQGGTCIVRPLQGTVFLADKQIEPALQTFVKQGADWALFTTGIGTNTLLDTARNLDIEEQFLQVLQDASIATRGYKTVAALKKIGIKPDAVDEDGTTQGLIQALKKEDFSGKKVMVQLHGISAPPLIDFLEEKGADVLQILPYQHIPPEEETVHTLTLEIINREVDAVCFTTAIQVHSLFQYAKENEYLEQLLDSFEQDVLAVAVGKVTAEGMKENEMTRLLSPDLERMGAMIIELSRYYEAGRIILRACRLVRGTSYQSVF
ncbi:uroporphyrinogen-III synthase [Thalassobacillus sp. C254]|uniref:uroporphyrinogen-III synthase n=1 Tax=Thalassobacillus sp. C254 TaxID=1225341 RepID=UPI0006D1509A|nr:uroporphyrinogen-III synthase [Thalassobacillus sp. C254]